MNLDSPLNHGGSLTDLSLTTAPKLATSWNSLPRRWAEGVLFVAIWMGLGWLLALDP